MKCIRLGDFHCYLLFLFLYSGWFFVWYGAQDVGSTFVSETYCLRSGFGEAESECSQGE